MAISQHLVMLTLLYDAAPEMFADELADFERELTAHSLLYGGPRFRIRHLAREDGRQRFVVFAGAEQFDCFDFSAAVVGGEGFGGDDVSGIDFEDPAFGPFDVEPRG